MVDPSAVGRAFTPVTARVEPGRLRSFLDTLGEGNPAFRDPAAGLVPPLVPPTYLFCLEMMDADDPLGWLAELGIPIARILHGEQGFTYHAPVRVGDVLTFRSRLSGVTEKKGGAMTLVMIDTAVGNQHGTPVAELSRTIVVRNPVPA